MKEFRKKYTEEYLKEIGKVLDSMKPSLVDKIDKIASIFSDARTKKKTIYFMGNGGSASTASHLVCDLSKLTIAEGLPRFKSISLTDNIPTMLAWANDNDYEEIFIEQLKNLMEPEDVVVGISGSGNSMNIINAIAYANKFGATTIGFCGQGGGKLHKCAKETINVPSDNMQIIEDIHTILTHLLTSLIRDEVKQK